MRRESVQKQPPAFFACVCHRNVECTVFVIVTRNAHTDVARSSSKRYVREEEGRGRERERESRGWV